jgi:MFS family permease
MEAFPEHVTDLIAMFETLIGLGYALGPVIGSTMYLLAGYKFTFASTGALMILLTIPTICLQRASKGKGSGKATPPAPLRQIINRTTVSSLVLVVLAMASFGYIEPKLEIHLDAILGLSQGGIGAFFTFFSITYAIITPFVGRIIKLMGGPVRTIHVGLWLVVSSLFLIGPSPILTAYLDGEAAAWITQLLAVALVSFGVGLMFVPLLPLMESSVRDLGDAGRETCIGMFNSMAFFGEGMGPVFASTFSYVAPSTTVINCDPETAINHCISSYAWASTLFAATVFIIGIFAVCVLGCHQRYMSRQRLSCDDIDESAESINSPSPHSITDAC